MNGDVGDLGDVRVLEDALQGGLSGALTPGVLLPLFRMRIQGIEVTQGIQHYRSSAHLTDRNDRAPDNTISLIAGKPAWVRVYLRAGMGGGDVADITGELEVRHRRFGFIYQTVATLSPQPPGTATARENPDYATERNTLGWTLNFLLPAELVCGNLELVARIDSPADAHAEHSVRVGATLQQTLRLAGIMVGYNGPSSSAPNAPNLTLAAPSLANLQTTSAWTLLTFPVQSAATYRSVGTITWDRHLQDAASSTGGCSPNWYVLNEKIQEQRVADGNRTDVLYYGLMALGIPMGPVVGCNSSGVSAGPSTDGVTMAHELGHACGLPHAPCGTTGDPSYPAYEPYDPANTPQASIGEYGLDISNGGIMSPELFKDMMSYCGPRWISLYNYEQLTGNLNLDPIRTCVDRPLWHDIVLQEWELIPHWLPDPPPDPIWMKRFGDPAPLISIIGMVHSPMEIEVKSVMRLDATPHVAGALKTSLMAELVSVDGNVLASAPLHHLQSQAGCGCGCDDEEPDFPYLFQAFVPDQAPGAQLQIRGREEAEPVWVRPAPKRRPRVHKLRARVGKDGSLDVAWNAESHGDQEAVGWLQWSGDGGKSWHALATGLRGEVANVSLAGVNAGRVLLRLLISDGFYTAQSKRVAVQVPRRAPEVGVLTPRDGQTLIAGSPMRLWGSALLDSGEPAAEKSARWLLDGKGVAQGFDVFVEAPPPGKHRLSLVVTENRRKAEHSIEFATISVPRSEEELED